MSSRQASKLREYSILRKFFLLAHTVCQVCRKKPATEVHHKHRRGRFLLDVSTWLATCGPYGCHDYIEKHPSWARANGYLA